MIFLVRTRTPTTCRTRCARCRPAADSPPSASPTCSQTAASQLGEGPVERKLAEDFCVRARAGRCSGTARRAQDSRAGRRGWGSRRMRRRAISRRRSVTRARCCGSTALLACRRRNFALLLGEYRAVTSHPDVLSYERCSAAAVLVVVNMADGSRQAALGLSNHPARAVLVGTHREPGTTVHTDSLRLEPLEALVLERA